MTKWCLALLLCLSGTAQAATYYVRVDGNSACSGLVDAAYNGGTSCAKATPAQGVAAMAGGDTLVIKNGSYQITSALQPPSGGSGATTKVYGEAYADCTVRPELWGSGGRSRIFDLSGRSYVELACMEITDHSDCVYGHPTMGCGSSTTHARDGIYAYDAAHLTFRDLNIHGLENGFHGGLVNTMTLLRVRLNANSKAGFHGATGKSGELDAFSGAMTFTQVEMGWNGCTEDYPTLKIHGCFGERRSGYGDGLGTYHSGGTWVFEDVSVHHNTTDGLDLRYTTLSGASVTIRRSRFWANAGNQVKVWGRLTLENSYLNSWCGYFGTRYGTDGSGRTDPEPCRASGNTLAVFPDNCSGTCTTIRFNTIAGHSEALIQFGSGGSSIGSYTPRIENNIVVGSSSYLTGSNPKFVSNMSGVSYTLHNNHVYGAGSVSCTASQCVTTDPLLVSRVITAFDPRPQAGSPVIGAGGCSGCTTPSTDINGKARPSSPSRGAFEP